MNTVTAATLVPLLPCVAAVLILLTGRHAPGFVRPLAVLPTLAATALATLVAVRQGGGDPITAATGLTPTGSPTPGIDLALHLDGPAVLLAVLVTAVASAVQLYATSALRDDPRYPTHAALVALLTAALLLVIATDDLVILLVGWETLGLCAALLVSNHRRQRTATRRAFLLTTLADLPFLAGVLLLAADTGTFRVSHLTSGLTSPLSAMELSNPTVLGLLLLTGIAAKSALVPLHTRPPHAAAGSTPVPALLHAATLAAAGVYLAGRLLPVLTASAVVPLVLAALAVTLLVGTGLAALAQDDPRRVLAYATLGQLGLAAGALAVGSRDAALFHLLTHGTLTALLFLATGALTAAAGTGSLTALARLSGLGRRAPDAYWTLTVGLLALAAVPPFAGFFSRTAVLAAAEHTALDPDAGATAATGWLLITGGLVGAGLTAAYALRIWLLLFHDPAARRTATPPDQPRAGRVVPLVLWLLAVPALTLGLAFQALPDWLDGDPLGPRSATALLTLAAVALGAAATHAAWRHRYPSHPYPDPGPALLGRRLHRAAAAGFHLGTARRRLAALPLNGADRLLATLDRHPAEPTPRDLEAAPGPLCDLVHRFHAAPLHGYLAVLAAGTALAALTTWLGAVGG